MKITKLDLDDIFHLAHREFVNEAMGNLTEKQFRTKCYVEAIRVVLKLDITAEYDPQPLEVIPAGEY